MTTPRVNYFLVYASIRNEPWSNDVLALAVRLMAEMKARYAEGDLDWGAPLVVDAMTLKRLAGFDRLDVATRSAERLGNVSGTFLTRSGNVFEIRWPKFWKLQKKATRKTPRTETETETETKKEEEHPSGDAEAASAPESPVGEKHPKILNLIAKLPGKNDEKEAWWSAEGASVEAWAEAHDKPLKVAVLAFYRTYLKDYEDERDRPYFDAADKARCQQIHDLIQDQDCMVVDGKLILRKDYEAREEDTPPF